MVMVMVRVRVRVRVRFRVRVRVRVGVRVRVRVRVRPLRKTDTRAGLLVATTKSACFSPLAVPLVAEPPG